MNNKILEYVTKQRGGHYCHAIEVDSVEALKSCIDALIEELQDKFNQTDFVEFFTTISVICCDDSNEDDVYSFDIEAYTIQQCLG